MQIVTLYKYTREGGGTSVSPVKPEGEYTEMYRLIADEGKVLTNGETITTSADTETPEDWTEVDEPSDDEPTEAAIYDDLAQVYREGVNSIDK